MGWFTDLNIGKGTRGSERHGTMALIKTPVEQKNCQKF